MQLNTHPSDGITPKSWTINWPVLAKQVKHRRTSNSTQRHGAKNEPNNTKKGQGEKWPLPSRPPPPSIAVSLSRSMAADVIMRLSPPAENYLCLMRWQFYDCREQPVSAKLLATTHLLPPRSPAESSAMAGQGAQMP